MPVRKFEEEDRNGMLSKNKKAPIIRGFFIS